MIIIILVEKNGRQLRQQQQQQQQQQQHEGVDNPGRKFIQKQVSGMIASEVEERKLRQEKVRK